MYSNVTPPALPEWNTSAYPYYVLVFVYEKGQTDWYGVRLVYSAVAFTWNGSAVTNAGTAGNMIYSAKDGAWGEDTLAGSVPEIKPGLGAGVYQRICTNHDIKDSAGNTWLADGSITGALETVTEGWLRSFQTGLALGLAGKPLPIKKEPVAYLYNGVRLPKLPDWDKETYPYAVIGSDPASFLFGGTSMDAYHTFTVFTALKSRYTAEGWGLNVYIPAIRWYFDGDKWVINQKYTVDNHPGASMSDDGSYYISIFRGPFWANRDLYDSDGNLIIATSEPVPVYE